LAEATEDLAGGEHAQRAALDRGYVDWGGHGTTV
jgi:hypothetical protein